MKIEKFFTECSLQGEAIQRWRRERMRWSGYNESDHPTTEVRLVAELAAEFWSTTHAWKALLKLLRKHALVWLSDDVFVTCHHDHGLTIHRNWGILAHLVGTEGADLVKTGVSFAPFRNAIAAGTVTVCSLVDREPTRGCEMVIRSIFDKPASYEFEYEVEVFDVDYTDDEGYTPTTTLPISTETLAYFLRMSGASSGAHQQRIDFRGALFSRAQCEVLSAFHGSLRFHFDACAFEDRGSYIFRQIAEGRGPTELEINRIRFDAQHLWSALKNTTSLRELELVVPEWDDEVDGSFNVSSLVDALGENKSLTKLKIGCEYSNLILTENEWDSLFIALRNHPMLESISLWVLFPDDDDAKETRERRARAVADMLKVNETICRLDIRMDEERCSDRFYEEMVEQFQILSTDMTIRQLLDGEILERQIRPRIKSNSFRRKLLDLTQDDADKSIRPLLFNAVLENPVVRRDPSLVWTWMSVFREEVVAHLDDRVVSRKRGRKSSKNSSKKKVATES